MIRALLLAAILIPTQPLETPPRPPAYVQTIPTCAPGALHILWAEARDAAGNVGVSAGVEVCVSNGGRRESPMRVESP